VRELIGDIYFGQPRGRRKAPDGAFAGEREGFDTMRYSEPAVVRIAHVAFKAARTRRKKVCSNVLQTSQLWRETMKQVGAEYPDVELSHLYIDNAAAQFVRAPTAFDVIVTATSSVTSCPTKQK
jgi:3-isopropylmalate dehydrogenase